MTSKEMLIIRSIEEFYDKNRDYLGVVKEITVGRNHTISLRILDWLVTSYARRHNTVIMHRERVTHLHTAYKLFLASHSKKLFDAFRRRKRVYVTESGKIKYGEMEDPFMISTVAQLVFFAWSFEIGLLEFAQNHIRDIEDDLRRYRVPSLKSSFFTKKT